MLGFVLENLCLSIEISIYFFGWIQPWGLGCQWPSVQELPHLQTYQRNWGGPTWLKLNSPHIEHMDGYKCVWSILTRLSLHAYGSIYNWRCLLLLVTRIELKWFCFGLYKFKAGAMNEVAPWWLTMFSTTMISSWSTCHTRYWGKSHSMSFRQT